MPASALIGQEGNGFRYVIDGWNAERILLASEAIGDGYWFFETAIRYANNREVFGQRSAPTRGCSSRWPALTCRSWPPT